MRRSDARGQSLLEFALALPIIVLIMFGILDLGRAVFAFNTLAESARQANRLAIVDQREDEIRNQAIAYAPALRLQAGDVEVCFKSGESLASSCGSGAECGAPLQTGCLAIVTTSMTFSPATPIISSLAPSIELSSTSVGPIEYVCPRPGRSTCP